MDDWPEGLKLNTELSSFLVYTLLGALEFWARKCAQRFWLLPTLNLTPRLDILRSLSHHFPNVVYVTGLSGYGGLTVLLSICLDIFGALTLHVSLSYLMLKSALLYQISALRSLFNLFRGTIKTNCPLCVVVSRAAGKRFNVLHRRIDSWHYEVDQLILGTLLFTLFTFSFPTLLTYGILFALVCDLLLWVSVKDNICIIDEVSNSSCQQSGECCHGADESLSAFCSFVEN